jgi:hypothetical protein
LPPLAEPVDPVVDTLMTHPEEAGDFAHGFPLIDFQDGQKATIQPGIVGVVQLLP